MKLRFFSGLIFFLGLIFLSQEVSRADELVVYSARKEHLIKPLFDAYEKATGVKVKFTTDKASPLLQRLKSEAESTPADVLITVDAGNLWHAANEGLLAEIDSTTLNENIPAHLKDPGNRWFGLSKRARTIVYSTERVKPSELFSYESLGTDAWKGKLCLRTSKKVYNQSLVAMMIAEHGTEKTQMIVESWIGNLATSVFSNDTAVLEAVAAGQCDVGIVNTYYFGRLLRDKPDLPLALFWPNQDGSGVHVNISGAGVVKFSKKKELAQKFIEWLSSEEAQNLFADSNLEYPVNPKVAAHADVVAWGSFKENVINVSEAGALQQESVKLMDKAGYK